MHQPEVSQPLCTALQVAIVDLLYSWKVDASVSVGHSSGEIAAAFATGAISRESAWMIAYFRGLAVAITRDLVQSVGAMVAIMTTPELLTPLLVQLNAAHPHDHVVIACYNSPSNLTISGSREAVNRLILVLKDAKITFKPLNVDIAYHSHHMGLVAAVYDKLLRPIEPGEQRHHQSNFVSTVTGKPLEDTCLLGRSEYWMKNLTAPVQFSQAMTEVYSGARHPVNLVVEIGPHCTLRSPLRDFITLFGGDAAKDYVSLLHRGRAADVTALECAGKLHAAGSLEDLASVDGNHTPNARLLTSLPPYPFNEMTMYWLEGRESAQYRFRDHAHHEFLGTRVADWNEQEARWTNRILLDQSVWLRDHQINGLIVFPAAGFMVMAIEAARQVNADHRLVLGYRMRDVQFLKAVTFSREQRGTELQLTLRSGRTQSSYSPSTLAWDEFTIYVYESNGWSACCSGAVAVEYEEESQGPSEVDERGESLAKRTHCIKAAMDNCHIAVASPDIYDAFERAGLSYGPLFRGLQDVKWNEAGQATGAIHLQHWKSGDDYTFTDPHLIHPAALDTILQMTFPAHSIYAKNASATTIPTGFRSAWFSAKLANASPDQKALVHAKVSESGFRSKMFSITAVMSEREVPCFYGEMETSTIGGVSQSSDAENKSKQHFKIEYKPDFDLLPRKALFLEPDTSKDPTLMLEKESLCLVSMRKALDQIPHVPESLPFHLQEYVHWMRIKAGQHPHTSGESFGSLCQRLENCDVEARLLVRVAANLTSILSGELDALNLLFADDILSDFYANFHSNQQLLSRAAEEVDILAHKFPNMRVLEIGAGTGSATMHVLNGLKDRIAEYVYTDITPSFSAKAKERFSSEKMTFRTLDISHDPLEQGFKEGDFDLIVAANASISIRFSSAGTKLSQVLHAANGIQNSLAQARKLLRPHGRILLLEMTNREHLLEPFIFGLLPGLSRESSPEAAQNQSPLLNRSEWGDMLFQTGFSGLDTYISDAGFITEDEVSAVMISTAVVPPITWKSIVNVISDHSSATQAELLQHLQNTLTSRESQCLVHVPWEAVIEYDLVQSVCVFLVAWDGNLLGQMQENELDKLKHIFSAAQTLIWVTQQTAAKDQNPTEGLVPGLARTLATEFEDCRVVSVTLDPHSGLPGAASNIDMVINSILQARGEPEDEYVEYDGLLHIPRVIQDHSMTAQACAVESTVTKPWSELEHPHLTIGTVGRLGLGLGLR